MPDFYQYIPYPFTVFFSIIPAITFYILIFYKKDKALATLAITALQPIFRTQYNIVLYADVHQPGVYLQFISTFFPDRQGSTSSHKLNKNRLRISINQSSNSLISITSIKQKPINKYKNKQNTPKTQ